MLETRPDGFEPANTPVTMRKGAALSTPVGTFLRRDGACDIGAADRASLDAQVADGLALITARLVTSSAIFLE